MNELINKVAKYLEDNHDKKNAQILREVATELLDVREAFELGRALQSIYETQLETSHVGIDEAEIGEVINFVRENIKQAKY